MPTTQPPSSWATRDTWSTARATSEATRDMCTVRTMIRSWEDTEAWTCSMEGTGPPLPPSSLTDSTWADAACGAAVGAGAAAAGWAGMASASTLTGAESMPASWKSAGCSAALPQAENRAGTTASSKSQPHLIMGKTYANHTVRARKLVVPDGAALQAVSSPPRFFIPSLPRSSSRASNSGRCVSERSSSLLRRSTTSRLLKPFSCSHRCAASAASRRSNSEQVS